MWRKSKKKHAPSHPRRQLMVKGDDVYNMFLKWPEYLKLKEELMREDSRFTDPCRTTFLSTRCGCLGEWMREGSRRSAWGFVPAAKKFPVAKMLHGSDRALGRQQC